MSRAKQTAVLVAIPTFRRIDWLRELLSHLGPQLEEVPQASVLVLDNDHAGSARPIQDHVLLREGFAEYLHVGAGDVVSVRNAALDEAAKRGASHLVFLDDDELPDPGWLAALVGMQRLHGADVVAGPVRQRETTRNRPHVKALLSRDERDAGPFKGDVGSGNVLLSMDFVHRSQTRFDTRLKSLGGEDTLFFRQAARAGALVCWAPEAVAVERASPDRLTRSALLRRSLANGRSSVIVDEALGQYPPLLRRAGMFGGSLAFHGVFAGIARIQGRQTQAWVLLHRIARHAGRLLGGRGAGKYGGIER